MTIGTCKKCRTNKTICYDCAVRIAIKQIDAHDKRQRFDKWGRPL